MKKILTFTFIVIKWQLYRLCMNGGLLGVFIRNLLMQAAKYYIHVYATHTARQENRVVNALFRLKGR